MVCCWLHSGSLHFVDEHVWQMLDWCGKGLDYLPSLHWMACNAAQPHNATFPFIIHKSGGSIVGVLVPFRQTANPWGQPMVTGGGYPHATNRRIPSQKCNTTLIPHWLVTPFLICSPKTCTLWNCTKPNRCRRPRRGQARCWSRKVWCKAGEFICLMVCFLETGHSSSLEAQSVLLQCLQVFHSSIIQGSRLFVFICLISCDWTLQVCLYHGIGKFTSQSMLLKPGLV